MIDPSNIVAFLLLLAGLSVLFLAPTCWFVVRSAAMRTTIGARRSARRIRRAQLLLLIPGAVLTTGGVVASLMFTFTSESGEHLAMSLASAKAGILSGLISLLFRSTARSVARLVEEPTDDQELQVDRRIGNIAVLGWVAAGLLTTFALMLIPLTLVLFLLVLTVGVPLTVHLIRARRQCQLLWIIAVTVRSKRDLPAELRHHASCSYGHHAASVRQLAVEIENGLSLGEALLVARENSRRSTSTLWRLFLKFNPLSLLIHFFFGQSLVLPAWVIAGIRTGEKTGTLEQTLAETSKQYLDSIRTRFTLSNMTGLIAYLLAYASIAFLIVGFLMVFIMPKFKHIFASFGAELPGITTDLLTVSDLAVDFWYVFVLLGIYPLRLMIRLGIGEPLAWKNLNSKLLAKCFPRVDAPDVLRQLGAVIRTGQPLTTALNALAQSHQRDSARKSLSEVLASVEAGGDCWEQLKKTGYLRNEDLQLLRVATSAGNLPWALDALAGSRERTLEHRLQVAVSFAEPVLIIAFGLLCGFIIIGFFMPVAKLVNDLS